MVIPPMAGDPVAEELLRGLMIARYRLPLPAEEEDLQFEMSFLEATRSTAMDDQAIMEKMVSHHGASIQIMALLEAMEPKDSPQKAGTQ
jgi:hypothetical protein